jgi:hypothetical protein
VSAQSPPSANAVYGQAVFTQAGANGQNPSASVFHTPEGIAVYGTDLYVVDTSNHRVLYFPNGASAATHVYGQLGSFLTTTANNGGISADSLYTPTNVLATASGVYIADHGNNRVLYYSGTSTTASTVYGQGGSFTTGTQNTGGVSGSSLFSPTALALDGSNNLYVVDSSNNRVLFFSSGSTTATRVYGQPDMASSTANNGGISATSLNLPVGVAVGPISGKIYVADYSNNRVLVYPSGGSTTASAVYGQGGAFTTNAPNSGSLSGSSLNGPLSVAVDPSENLFVADSVNNRVLKFTYQGSTSASGVYGHSGSYTSSTPGTSVNTLNVPNSVAATASGVYISDTNNNRVLYFSGSSTTATTVWGQHGLFINGQYDGMAVSASTLLFPQSVAADTNGDVYVADSSNNRVLYYSSGSTIATRVYG